MDDSRQRSTSEARPNVAAVATAAATALPRLIPFPGAEDATAALTRLSLPPRGSAPRASATGAPVDAARQQAATIVSEAAAILDEEMARGVLAARRADTASPNETDVAGPILRQVHELVDRIATGWPALAGVAAPSSGGAPSASSEAEPVAELRPWATVKPGERATISMTLSNSESRPVHLMPLATDLIGSRTGRILSSSLELSPSECQLEPGEQHDLRIEVRVPPETAAGCYSGLLVVRGVEYLRGLVTIEVA